MFFFSSSHCASKLKLIFKVFCLPACLPAAACELWKCWARNVFRNKYIPLSTQFEGFLRRRQNNSDYCFMWCTKSNTKKQSVCVCAACEVLWINVNKYIFCFSNVNDRNCVLIFGGLWSARRTRDELGRRPPHTYRQKTTTTTIFIRRHVCDAFAWP